MCCSSSESCPLVVSQGQDLMSGNLTAPALYALRNAEAGDELRALIDSEFNDAGGLPRAIELVNVGGGIEQARTLARCHAEKVCQTLMLMLDGDFHPSYELHMRVLHTSMHSFS